MRIIILIQKKYKKKIIKIELFHAPEIDMVIKKELKLLLLKKLKIKLEKIMFFISKYNYSFIIIESFVNYINY